MEYRELINRVFNAFYESDKDFPRNMLYPILRYDSIGDIVDMFIVCHLTRNPNDGTVEKIESIRDIFFNGVKTEKQEFVSIEEDNREFSFDFPKSSEKVSAKDFTLLYMKTREFAFGKQLTEEQIETLKKIVSIYEESFEAEARMIYHKYGYDFFEWAYRILSNRN